MSRNDLFDMPGTSTTPRAFRKPQQRHGNRAPRAELRHVAAPAGWQEQQKGLPATNSDLAALRKAFRIAAAHDADAALNVLSKYNLKSLADVRKADVCNVHFDLVMLDLYHTYATC